VPELPEDPAEYINYLKTLNLFETASYTSNDTSRTLQYQEEAIRNSEELSFSNQDDFLKSLDMIGFVEGFNNFNIPRVAQLIQRSNQFNLRTIRYSEEDIVNIANSNEHLGLAFKLKDKFGDYGLISVVILKKELDYLFIDTWVMSCRVLKRGVEDYVLQEIIKTAKKLNCEFVKAEYIATLKNKLVENLLSDLNFFIIDGKWTINIEKHVENKHLIKIT
jgi:FkbH-like protein